MYELWTQSQWILMPSSLAYGCTLVVSHSVVLGLCCFFTSMTVFLSSTSVVVFFFSFSEYTKLLYCICIVFSFETKVKFSTVGCFTSSLTHLDIRKWKASWSKDLSSWPLDQKVFSSNPSIVKPPLLNPWAWPLILNCSGV